MATADSANGALSSPIADDTMPTSSQFENNGGAGGELLQHSFTGGPAALEPEPNHTSVHKFFKGKETVGRALSERSGRLTLLELPVDILRLIVQEVPHTNDLASLALVNSTLHSLAVPHIYSRFDIVWPDSAATVSDSKSVDALTYGLSTLCLGSKFAHRINKIWNPNNTPGARQLKVDHDYSKYIRKFSLGNGPEDWVSEYHIFKEGGKMLGTLVALAIEKMANLEAFVWDMPTGVLSEVFLALASSQDETFGHKSKLDRVWIRLHDSSFSQEASQNPGRSMTLPPPMPEGTTLTTIGLLPPSPHDQPGSPAPLSYSESPVEYPTFSVLPPLRNLTVLEIDDLSYLDEMSVLISRSQSRLQELRIGMAAKVMRLDFAQPWDGPGLQQVDRSAHWPGESKIGSRRLGGVLGVLFGRVFDLRRLPPATAPVHNNTLVVTMPIPQGSDTGLVATPHESILQPTNGEAAAVPPSAASATEPSQPHARTDTPPDHGTNETRQRLDGKLRLRILELEHVPLSMQVLIKGVDWTTLTTLTLLDCPHQMTLWKLLARHFSPTSSIAGLKGPSAIKNAPPSSLQYHLALKHIHTDNMGLPLLKFIKETLAPNTLETLFAHDRRALSSRVSLQRVFRLAVTRHCRSLRKLLLNSSEDTSFNLTAASESTRWLLWTLTTEMILYISSGKLPQLRELSIALAANSWHTLLRRLPNIPHLRALDIHHISSRDTLASTTDLAQQLVDVVTLRPEVQLRYVGLLKDCFEILEAEPSSGASGAAEALAVNSGVLAGSGPTSVTGDDDETASNGSVSQDEESVDGVVPGSIDALENQSELESAWGSDGDSLGDTDSELSSREFQARPFPFYDEVSIFKARRVRL